MFRIAPRTLLRASAPRPFPRVSPTRRFLSTAPPTQKSRSWKSSAVRWGLAGGAVYWYSTTNVFAEQPTYIAPPIPGTENEIEQLPTLETISAQRKQRQQSSLSESSATSSTVAAPVGKEDGPVRGSPEELEEEADQQGAFNPETGEINWDCPCLGGMAQGPCGEEFKLAFSCFVYSKEEPKGMDCIDKFKGMQDCFRQHPEVYGEEMEDEDDMSAEDADASATPQPASGDSAVTQHPSERTEKVATRSDPEPERAAKRDQAKKAAEQVKKEHAPLDESDEAVPKAWHDTTSSNVGK